MTVVVHLPIWLQNVRPYITFTNRTKLRNEVNIYKKANVGYLVTMPSESNRSSNVPISFVSDFQVRLSKLIFFNGVAFGMKFPSCILYKGWTSLLL